MVGSALMQLPNVQQWNSGMIHDEVLFNDLQYAMTFLLSPPEAEIHQTAAQSIPNGTTTGTPITFDSVTKDNDGMWNASAPTRLTINTTGWYELEWAVHWAAVSDDTIRIQAVSLNGALAIGSLIGYYDHVNASGTATPEVRVCYDYFLNAGDYIQLAVMQGTGSSLSTASSGTVATDQTFLRARWSSM